MLASEPTLPGQTLPDVAVHAHTYVVNAAPAEHPQSPSWEILVQRVDRPADRWVVTRWSDHLSADGTWTREPRSARQRDTWQAAHQFPLNDALALARRAAPDVTVNGIAARDLAPTPPSPNTPTGPADTRDIDDVDDGPTARQFRALSSELADTLQACADATRSALRTAANMLEISSAQTAELRRDLHDARQHLAAITPAAADRPADRRSTAAAQEDTR